MKNKFYEIIYIDDKVELLKQKTFPSIKIPTFCYIVNISKIYKYDFINKIWTSLDCNLLNLKNKLVKSKFEEI